MVFNSLLFGLFLTALLALHFVTPRGRPRKGLLLLASYGFYAAWSPPFVLLLWISTAVDWFAAKGMASSRTGRVKRLYLYASLATNLGLLGAFKYGDFLLENGLAIAGPLGFEHAPFELDIILPVGISFYTFQSLSYTVDVYRGRLDPWPSALDFALYVTFFPQLVAGPIVRAADFLPQCEDTPSPTRHQLGWGFTLLLVGLFNKVVLADAVCAPVADLVYGSASSAGFTTGWLGTLAFSGQIYFDFAGYSTAAIGVAMLFGFALPDNFRWPYAAVGFSDFWRRWHISLSSWLRDYLYIPLGGNRKGDARTSLHLAITMLLGGLWHGASWQFVIWGALHGAYLMVERAVRARVRPDLELGALGRFALALLTYVSVCVAWVFFRARDLSAATDLLAAMLCLRPAGSLEVETVDAALVAGLTLWLLASHFTFRDVSLEEVWARFPWWGRAALLAALMVGIVLFAPTDDHAFIYFQF